MINMCKPGHYKKVDIFVIIAVTFFYRRVSEDDARSTFQLARSNAKNFAIVFVAWAQFELSTGLIPIIIVPYDYIFVVKIIFDMT